MTGPGTLSFWWKVSSESGYDFLRVMVDNTEAGKISGEVDWQQRELTFPAGAHTIRWCYSKDVSLSRGADAGWVDQVSFIAAPPPPIVYVDWRNTASVPDGSLAKPFPRVSQGVAAVANGGDVRIRAGSYALPAQILNGCLRLESYDGRVLISVDGLSTTPATGATASQLSAPVRNGDGSLAFHFGTTQGTRYQVLSSTNLVNWEVWKDFTADGATAELVHPNAASEPRRFFRIVIP